jgi:hypothetical protein
MLFDISDGTFAVGDGLIRNQVDFRVLLNFLNRQ